MPNRPGNDDRITATGNGQRDTSNDNSRQTGGQQGGSARSRSNRGFASMDREKQREIASKGGRAAHAKGTAHEFDSGEAREAGRKGGMAVSRNRDHMAAIGRRGGEARGQSRGRGSSQTNSAGVGSNVEGSFQNSRGGQSTERQVAINNNSDHTSENSPSNAQNNQGNQGNRGGNASIGGRPGMSGNESRSDNFGNR
jgi:uncharacterized protein